MKNNNGNVRFRQFLLAGLILMMVAMANPVFSVGFTKRTFASPTRQINCPLVVSGVVGDVTAGRGNRGAPCATVELFRRCLG